ncbi:MAG: transglutaminase domain-containing protein [Planctomycetes bacterium]|nr:transglutaminase domain-containing protein [Planctomycetota bacterium]
MIGLVTSACTNGFQDAKVNDAQIPTSEVPFVGVVGLPSQQLLTELPCPQPSVIASYESLPSVNHITANAGRQRVFLQPELSFDCNTREWLTTVASLVVSDKVGNLQKAMRWTAYIQDTIAHSCLPPIDEQAQAVYHPVALLKDRRMHCGQTARLVVDGLTTLGIPARVLQMNGHVSAEFFAEGRWRLAEANILSRREFLLDREGNVVGVDEALVDVAVLDTVNPYSETSCWNLLTDTERQFLKNQNPSSDFGTGSFNDWMSTFESQTYGDPIRGSLTTPFVIKKTASLEEERSSHYFGWNYYEFCERSDPSCTN